MLEWVRKNKNLKEEYKKINGKCVFDSRYYLEVVSLSLSLSLSLLS